MRGRLWIVFGVAAGVAMALGDLPWLAGAGRTLAGTCLGLVDSGAKALIHAVADHGAPRRVLLGLSAVIAVAVPGLTAWLAILAARGSLRLRGVIAAVLVVLGAASFAYHPAGVAGGSMALALVVAALAVVLTGPLVAAPLAALAGLLGGTFLPALVLHGAVAHAVVEDLHVALYGRPGAPLVLVAALVVVAAAPFIAALRDVVRA
ncbi:MAG: hypothetical protein ACYDEN_06040 [Acidimicrobiales bacterium]